MGKQHNGGVPPPQLPNNEKLKFSFEYYDVNSDKYCISKWNQTQIREAVLRLQEISTKSFNQLRQDRRVYHFNEVDWSQTNEKQGFPNQAVRLLSPFHFALLGVNGQLTRVYGAYSTGTFYIVWFDLNHEIWPSFKKHT